MTAFVRRLDAAGDITFGAGLRNFAFGAEGTAQRVRCVIRTIVGEWFLDQTAHIPWYQPDGSDVQPIMGGPRNLQYTEAVLKAKILATGGVKSIEAFSMSFDGNTRKLSISVTLVTVDGDVEKIVLVSP